MMIRQDMVGSLDPRWIGTRDTIINKSNLQVSEVTT
jgi:hypothetical protein